MTLTRERNATAETPPPAPRRQRWGMVLALILLGALALTVSGVFPFRQMVAQHRRVAAAEERYAALVAENRRLEERVARLGTDAEVERLARQEYGLVRPGEIGYVVVVPDGGTDPRADVTPADARNPAPRPWYRRIWEYLTGADLDRDG